MTRKNKKKRRNKNKKITEEDFFNSKNAKTPSPSVRKSNDAISKDTQSNVSNSNESSIKSSKAPASPDVDSKASPEGRGKLDSSVDDSDNETSDGSITPRSSANGQNSNSVRPPSKGKDDVVIFDLIEQLDGANAKIQGLRRHVAQLKKTKTSKVSFYFNDAKLVRRKKLREDTKLKKKTDLSTKFALLPKDHHLEEASTIKKT